MRFLTAPQIHIPENRQRQEFDPEALQDLKNSIEDRGLMHAIVVREVPGQNADTLVAGERRFRAISEIYELGGSIRYNGALVPQGAFPCVSLGELSELEAEEAELDENLKRRDLTWQEHAAAVERLHKLRCQQAEAKLEEGLESGDIYGMDASQIAEKFPKQTIADTARELYPAETASLPDGALGDYQAKTRKEIIVAKHLDNPVIAKAKNVDEAFKLLKKDEERKKNIELAVQVGATFTVDKHELLNENCLTVMRRIASAGVPKFDVICTDPPYGMGADEFGDAGGKLTGIEHHYDDSYEAWQKLMQAWCPLSFAIAKPQAHAYVFCDIDNFHELKSMMQAAGWYVFRTPFIAVKPNSGRVPLPDKGPRRQYETILYAIKGDKPTTHIYPDVITCAADENLSHGAQKPVALFQNLLQRSVRPGDWVFDGFAGTGPVFPAAHSFKCTAVGCEVEPEYYAKSLKRLRDMKALETPNFFATGE